MVKLQQNQECSARSPVVIWRCCPVAKSANYSKRNPSEKYALDFNGDILECGPCLSILALKSTICTRDVTEDKTLAWIQLTTQHEKNPFVHDNMNLLLFNETVPSRTTHENICPNAQINLPQNPRLSSNQR